MKRMRIAFVMILLACFALIATPAFASWGDDCEDVDDGVAMGGNYNQDIDFSKYSCGPGSAITVKAFQAHSAWGKSYGGQGNINNLMHQVGAWNETIKGADHFGQVVKTSYSELGVNPYCPEGYVSLNLGTNILTGTNYIKDGNQQKMHGTAKFCGEIFGQGSGLPVKVAGEIESQFGYHHKRGDASDLSKGPYIEQFNLTKIHMKVGELPNPD